MHEGWERKPRESARAYQAFTVYREMGAERALSKVAQELSKSVTLIGRWSKAWDWVDRCMKWDMHLNRLAEQAKAEAVIAVNKRHTELAMAFQSKIAQRLNAMTENALELLPSDLPRWLDIAVKIERLGLGMSTQVVEHAGKDGGAIRLDLIEQARGRLREKLTPFEDEPDKPKGGL